MSENSTPDNTQRLWKPIGKRLRRVLGVLVEKAKTTPDSYPLSVSALVAGCNQKSNRDPQMQLDEDDVTDALETLRALGAVREVQGSGRVNKFRHAAYEWLGASGQQAAVMTELMLRGPQTAGELRARASRMEPFADLDALHAVLDDLQAKELVIPLTPPGRGQLFAHALYEFDELQKIRSQAHQQVDRESDDANTPAHATNRPPAASSATETVPAAVVIEHPVSKSATGGSVIVDLDSSKVMELSMALSDAHAQIAKLSSQVNDLTARLTRLEKDLGIDA